MGVCAMQSQNRGAWRIAEMAGNSWDLWREEGVLRKKAGRQHGREGTLQKVLFLHHNTMRVARRILLKSIICRGWMAEYASQIFHSSKKGAS